MERPLRYRVCEGKSRSQSNNVGEKRVLKFDKRKSKGL